MFLKTLTRDVVYWAADTAGRLRTAESDLKGPLTILTYHRVLPDAEALACPFPSLAMPETWFRAQMSWLRRNARVLPLALALDRLRKEDPTTDGAPLVAVTFDDGYADNFAIAEPILREHGLRGTFFICTAPVRNGSRFWYDSIAEGTLRWGPAPVKRRLISVDGSLEKPLARAVDAHGVVAALKSAPDNVRRAAVADVERGLREGAWIYRSEVMTRDQVRALASAGHEIGSHTETHPILPALSEGETDVELRRSKSWLEELIGGPVPGFCYPNGDHSPATRSRVVEAGYSYACLTEEGRQTKDADPFLLRRIDVAPRRVSNCLGRGSVRSFRATICRLRRRGND